jgi:hypothetical protein
LTDRALAQRDQQVARLVLSRDARIDVDAGARDQRAVGLACRCQVCADEVHMRARPDPVSADHGLVRTGEQTDDVAGGRVGGRLHGHDADLWHAGAVTFCKSARPGKIPPPDAHLADLPHAPNGLEMRDGLHAATEESERPGVAARELARRKPARGSRAQRGDLRAVEQRERRTGRVIEQEDTALHRRSTLGRVPRMQAHELRPVNARRDRCTRHRDQAAAAIGERDHGAQRRLDAAIAQTAHRNDHCVDAVGHRQDCADAGSIERYDRHECVAFVMDRCTYNDVPGWEASHSTSS